MPEPFKLVIIELAGVVAMVGGVLASFTGNPFGLAFLLTGQRLLLRPEKIVDLPRRRKRGRR